MNQSDNSYENELEHIPQGNIYDTWILNSDMTRATRTSINNNVKEEVPITKEILQMIKKQETAKKELEKFISTPENHTEALSQMHPLINKHLDYLDINSLKQLIDKIIIVGKSDQVDTRLAEYFPPITEYINKKATGIRLDDESEELFEMFMTKFQQEIISRQQIEQQNVSRSTI